jgi:HlyD family secretion protein
MNPDSKVYITEIHIDGSAPELRAGMNCEVQIVVEQLEDALYVPLQAVVRVEGKPTVFVVGRDGPVEREVEIGLDNNRMIHILSGLEQGEKVLLTPPLEESAAPVTETVQPADEKSVTPADPKQEGAPPVDTSKSRQMSPEDRKKAFESLTPEQRQKMMEGRRRRGGGNGEGGRETGDTGGGGRPRREGGGGEAPGP